MSDKDLVTVEIYGQSYKLRGAGQKDYILRLADYLDAKMNQIVDSTGTVDSLKVAILAALNIADEYFQGVKPSDGLEISEERIIRMIEVLDDCID